MLVSHTIPHTLIHSHKFSEIFEKGKKKWGKYRIGQASSGCTEGQRQLKLRRISYFNSVINLLSAKSVVSCIFGY